MLEISIHAPRTGSDEVQRATRNRLYHFNPRSPHGERLLPLLLHWKKSISIHAPRTGSDGEVGGEDVTVHDNFNPRSPHGERLTVRRFFCATTRFQSTLPARGATSTSSGKTTVCRFQSTLPARGATPLHLEKKQGKWISIHAPRTGSDVPHDGTGGVRRISIHAPRTGSDFWFAIAPPTASISIHAPRTGSDPNRHSSTPNQSNFNPRSPHGERRRQFFRIPQRLEFQSTLPARGATRWRSCYGRMALFQSTLPARGATEFGFGALNSFIISIHAPRTGSDRRSGRTTTRRRVFQSTLPARGATGRVRQKSPSRKNFNPRSPHGERPICISFPICSAVFQSTLPARGATVVEDAPHCQRYDFNPRSPHGERLLGNADALLDVRISIHAPRTGSDWMVNFVRHNLCISIHAPRTGSDAFGYADGATGNAISIHAPRTGSDKYAKHFFYAKQHFNPRSPHGERHRKGDCIRPHQNFNPRSPHGERQLSRSLCAEPCIISIHAPRTGSDIIGQCGRTQI